MRAYEGKAYDSEITQVGNAMKAIVALFAIALPLCSFSQTSEIAKKTIVKQQKTIASTFGAHKKKLTHFQNLQPFPSNANAFKMR